MVAPFSHVSHRPTTPATVNLSQENPATSVTAQTLLLLTFGPEFDKTITSTISDQAQSLAQPSQHTEKLPIISSISYRAKLPQ